MKKALKIFATAAMVVAAVACSSASKMAEMAENVVITCDPEVLEVVAGSVTAKITAEVPAEYFHKKAILTVTPVIVYDGGEAEGSDLVYQGEKVSDNYTVVSYDGQTINEVITIPYEPGFEESYLELRGVVTYKLKTYDCPSRKLADGCNTTYMLANACCLKYKEDNYQETIPMTAEGQIMYKINSYDVASSQLKSDSIKDFQAALDEIAENERKTLVGTEVVAYASPDGAEDYNETLSGKRATSGNKAWGKVVSGKEVSDPEVKSVGEDWEGFQELVTASDIEDKDLILRVLSMYSDPAVRESEIKNMSNVYTILKDEVLPELRRARFIANVEYQNWTSDELVEMIDSNIDALDEEALLRAATLVDDLDTKIKVYEKAVKEYDSDRAQYNIGVANYKKGDTDAAKKAFDKVETKDGDLDNAYGVIAFAEGDIATAAEYFKKAHTECAKNNLAAVDIYNGKYEQAARALQGTGTHNEAIADILTGQASKVPSVLSDDDCPTACYIKAIAAARTGNSDAVKSNLETALTCEYLANRYETDIEFVDYK